MFTEDLETILRLGRVRKKVKYRKLHVTIMDEQYWDIRIVGAAYKAEAEEKLFIEIYGHTKEGKSIVIRDNVGDDYDKRPYCYIQSDDENLLGYLEMKREVLQVKPVTLFHKGKNIICFKVTTRLPKNVKQLREDENVHGTFFAADIPFHLRYIYDNDLDSCIRVYGKKTIRLDYNTQLTVDKIRYEKIPAFNPKMRILSFDIENSVTGLDEEVMEEEEEEAIDDDTFYNRQILCICCVLQENDKIVKTARIHGEEKQILSEFSRFITDNDPDIISGYNIEGYDLRVLAARASTLQTELPWGRDGSNLSGNKDPKYPKLNWTVNGRLIIDAWWAVKMELKPKQETLNAVSMQLLNEKKLDVDPRKMDEEWKKDKEKVLAYCEQDAVLSLKILNKLERVRKIMDLATVSKTPLAEVNKNRSSILIDSILIREADRNGAAVPLSTMYNDEDDVIEGAYVHELSAGLFNWICVLDFKSMYPSIIISKNICFTTISDEGTIISPIGAKFLDKSIKRGILPRILEGLMKERDETKKKMKEAQTEDEKSYYDGLQGAIKIYMNSFYGVFASSFYRFTDHNIGGSVTAFSRELTKSIISDLEAQGHKVLYSDTDSIFVKSPTEDLEGSKAFGFQLVEKYSKEGGFLEFEKIFKSMFSHGKKKRYVGKTAWPKEDMVIRGYEIRRTDSFEILSETMMEVFNKILENQIEESIKVARSTVQNVLKGKVDIEKLVISKGCKNFKQYKKPETQATVQTAKKLQALGHEFIPGMKVSWIVTNSKKSPQEVTPYIKDHSEHIKPDYKYYADRLSQSLSRITEVYGINQKDLLSVSMQTSLFGPNNKDDIKTIITNKHLNLADYM